MRVSTMTQRDVMKITGSSDHMCMIRYKLSHTHRNILFISQKIKKPLGSLIYFWALWTRLPAVWTCVTADLDTSPLQSHCWRARMTLGCVTFGFGVDSCCDVFELTTSHRVGLFIPDYQKAVLRHSWRLNLRLNPESTKATSQCQTVVEMAFYETDKNHVNGWKWMI